MESRHEHPRPHEPGAIDVRLMLLRDLERSLAERASEHVDLLAEVHALVVETERQAKAERAQDAA